MEKQQALKHCLKLAKHLSGLDSESEDAKAIYAVVDGFVPPAVAPYRLTEIKTIDIEIYPRDGDSLMTWLEASAWVKTLGNGWRLPTREELMLIFEHKDKIGGFKTNKASGSDFPAWYWSSTERRDDPSIVWLVRFSDGYVDWYLKDFIRLSCRPVRLVEVAASSPSPPGD